MYSDFSAWEWGMGIKGPLHYDAALDAAAAAADSLFLTPPNEAQRAMRVQGRRGGWVNEKCEKLTDIVVKQTGRGGCLDTVEIQTEIQV